MTKQEARDRTPNGKRRNEQLNDEQLEEKSRRRPTRQREEAEEEAPSRRVRRSALVKHVKRAHEAGGADGAGAGRVAPPAAPGAHVLEPPGAVRAHLEAVRVDLEAERPERRARQQVLLEGLAHVRQHVLGREHIESCSVCTEETVSERGKRCR